MCPKIVITEERKKDFQVCPHTKRFVNVKPQHKPLRAGLEAGRVVIILSGPYAGKRAVFLNQLENGHLLLNGPFGVNEVPLCAVPQKHVIITSSKIEGVKADVAKGFTFAMLCKPKGMSKKEQEEFAKGAAWIQEFQKKVDAAMVPLVKGDHVEYMKTPFVVRPQDKVHQFNF